MLPLLCKEAINSDIRILKIINLSIKPLNMAANLIQKLQQGLDMMFKVGVVLNFKIRVIAIQFVF